MSPEGVQIIEAPQHDWPTIIRIASEHLARLQSDTGATWTVDEAVQVYGLMLAAHDILAKVLRTFQDQLESAGVEMEVDGTLLEAPDPEMSRTSSWLADEKLHAHVIRALEPPGIVIPGSTACGKQTCDTKRGTCGCTLMCGILLNAGWRPPVPTSSAT